MYRYWNRESIFHYVLIVHHLWTNFYSDVAEFIQYTLKDKNIKPTLRRSFFSLSYLLMMACLRLSLSNLFLCPFICSLIWNLLQNTFLCFSEIWNVKSLLLPDFLLSWYGCQYFFLFYFITFWTYLHWQQSCLLLRLRYLSCFYPFGHVSS